MGRKMHSMERESWPASRPLLSKPTTSHNMVYKCFIFCLLRACTLCFTIPPAPMRFQVTIDPVSHFGGWRGGRNLVPRMSDLAPVSGHITFAVRSLTQRPPPGAFRCRGAPCDGGRLHQGAPTCRNSRDIGLQKPRRRPRGFRPALPPGARGGARSRERGAPGGQRSPTPRRSDSPAPSGKVLPGGASYRPSGAEPTCSGGGGGGGPGGVGEREPAVAAGNCGGADARHAFLLA